MSNTNTKDWLDQAFNAACEAQSFQSKKKWAEARQSVHAHIAANYVAKDEHEVAIDHELAAQKVMYTEAELRLRTTTERVEARLDELGYLSPATRRDKDGGLVGSVGGRIVELKDLLASLTTNSREED